MGEVLPYLLASDVVLEELGLSMKSPFVILIKHRDEIAELLREEGCISSTPLTDMLLRGRPVVEVISDYRRAREVGEKRVALIEKMRAEAAEE